MRKTIGLAAAAVLLLAGCGGSSEAAAPATESAVALPTERPPVGDMCGIETNAAFGQTAVLPLSLFSCGSLAEWMAGAEDAGFDVTPTFLEDVCKGQDVAPVCGDAIELGVIESTGSAELARLEASAEWCGVEGLADEGESLTFTATGSDAIATSDCILAKLDAPDYVTEHVGSTRAMDGQQTDEWNDLEARWTYHPDAGLNMTIIDRARA